MRKSAVLRGLSFCVAALAVTGATRDARAYYPFPGYIEAHLNISSLPAPPTGMGCELCHNNPNGGLGTATQPFGDLIRAQGIVYTSSEAEVDAAVDAIKANPATTAYITDIVAGVNPNTDPNIQDSNTSTPTVTPAYGCGATIAPGGLGAGSDAGAAAFGAAGLALVLRLRRRKAARTARKPAPRRG